MGLIARVILIGVVVLTFIIIVIVTAISLLVGQNWLDGQAALWPDASPRPNPAPSTTYKTLGTLVVAPATYRSVALGFSLDYPANWRKRENSLRVIFAPSPAGLELSPLTEPAIQAGIPANNRFEAAEVLADILAGLPANTKPSSQGTTTAAGIRWTLTDLNFADAGLDQPVLGRVAVTSNNEVGYYLLAMAPVEQWPAAQAAFEQMLNNFRFTQEAVIRPTDASPPPTPTASPTPRIYIVQPGDTLGGIALQFDVSIEAIVTRNGLEDARVIRSGQKLIIPNKKK